MYKVVNNRIYITRGDSRVINFDLLDTNGQETETTGKLVFTLKRSSDKEAVIVKEITGPIHFSSEDTKNLNYGEYLWDIQLIYNDGKDVDTVLFGEMVILKEVG